MAPAHKIAISSISMGWHDEHTLDAKLDAAAKHGYDGLELFWTDLEKDANARKISVEDNAQRVRTKCDDLGLGICSLSSFDNFEGNQTVPLSQRLDKARRWISVARTLGSPIVQIPANDDLTSLAASHDQCVDELRQLADIGLASPNNPKEATITWAYEPMAWSARDFTWQAALHTIQRVARPNLKLCLDTYHIVAKLRADCTTASGRVPGGQEVLEASMHDLPRMVRPQEIGFIQLSDAEKMTPPVTIAELNEVGKHYSHYWCMQGRLFPFEGYLPMREASNALLKDLGPCWVSQEIFHRTMKESEPRPEEWARRGTVSWGRVKECIEGTSSSTPRSKL